MISASIPFHALAIYAHQLENNGSDGAAVDFFYRLLSSRTASTNIARASGAPKGDL